MKPNYTKLSIVLLGLFYIALVMFFLYGCSASYHFGKFIKKGGKIENKTEYVTTTNTIKVNGKDSIITVRVPVTCPEIQIPPTRTEIRYKYKLQRDSIQTVRYVTKWKTKEVIKLAKTQNKKPFNWFWIGLGIGVILPILFRFVIKKI